MKNSFKYKSLLIKAFYILRVSRTTYYKKVLTMFRNLFFQEEWMPKNEQVYLYNHFVHIYRFKKYSDLCNIKFIQGEIRLFNRLERKYIGTNKRHGLLNMISDHADQTFPGIFYLASYHKNSADAHGKYQGRIYVDEHWSAIMDQHPELNWLVYPIASYIKGHNVKSIQWVSGLDGDKDSPYLMLRPYCKHFFIPLSTWDVLTSSLSAIKRDTPQAKMKSEKSNFNSKQYIRTLQSILVN